MALAYDAVSTGSGSGSFSVSHTCTGANLVLYVFIHERFTTAVTGVTYNGVAMTEISYIDPGGNNVVQKLYRLINPATGAHNISVTQTASHQLSVTGISFSGADQTTPNGTVVTSSAGPGTAVSDVVSSAAGSIVVDGVTSMENTAATVSLTVGAGQTERANVEYVSGGAGHQSGVSTEAGAASVTMSWTTTSSYYVHQAFSVTPAGGTDTTAPAVATVTAVEAAAGTAINLTITMPSDSDLSQYEIRRLTTDYPASDRSNGTIIVAATATTASATVNYSDSGLTNGQRYYYRVFCKDTTGNWNTGTTVSEVAASTVPVIGWYTSGGTFKSDGLTGANPIFEWTVSTAAVEASKPVPFHIRVGSDNPGTNLPPTADVLDFYSSDADGTFKYNVSGSWVTIPSTGVPWASVNAGTVTCRWYSSLNATQVLYASVRPEQV